MKRAREWVGREKGSSETVSPPLLQKGETWRSFIMGNCVTVIVCSRAVIGGRPITWAAEQQDRLEIPWYTVTGPTFDSRIRPCVCVCVCQHDTAVEVGQRSKWPGHGGGGGSVYLFPVVFLTWDFSVSRFSFWSWFPGGPSVVLLSYSSDSQQEIICPLLYCICPFRCFRCCDGGLTGNVLFYWRMAEIIFRSVFIQYECDNTSEL